MKKLNDQRIINCHTHIFTIDHVPNEFGKSVLSWPLYRIVTIKSIKWYYRNLTSRGSNRYRRIIHRSNRILFMIKDILKFTRILWWLYLIIRWIFKIILHLLILDSLFGPKTKALINRYKSLARYSIDYKNQSLLLTYLKKNYPPETQVVVLSMDMEYMGAGKPLIPYLDMGAGKPLIPYLDMGAGKSTPPCRDQIEDLKRIKKNNPEMLPFIFVDPRRIAATSCKKGKENYSILVESLLSRKVFNGIKIYPALGYYPFDRDLIPTYEYAQKFDIPIMTHCNVGPVFYRGKKKPEWDRHPILKYKRKGDHEEYIPLPQTKNYEFTSNFSHPLNYDCLLNKDRLSEFLGYEKDLCKLKICLGHFGGSDAWNEYKNDASNDYNNNISPVEESEYLKNKNTLNHDSPRTIWWNGSWLSIIYDLIVKYDNVYADVSYILSDEQLFPLLKYILQDDKVKSKILFGTDYYVVSKEDVDKVLYQNLRSYLGEELFMQISNTNAIEFLKTKI